ncbi:MAG: D-alanine-D-alanine ligase [Lysobacterales bacterium]|jgi:D-alanine-D-alanine ligase
MNTLTPQRIHNPAEFGFVGLLVGGDSAEREVSLDGGAAVARSLERSGVRYEVFDGGPALIEAIEAGGIDRVFNLMHGPGGEDGAIQGVLQLLRTPVTGSSLLGSALSMDKVRSKLLLKQQGISTTEFELVGPHDRDYGNVSERFGFPMFVKPCGLGSSIGVSKAQNELELSEAIDLARHYGDEVLVEPAVVGEEYFAGILGNCALPLIRIETPREFYDYEAKYNSDETKYFCPAGLDEDLELSLRQQSLQAFEILQASGWGRVDFILDQNNKPWFLEVNTIPGMTDHSLVPQAAAEMGINFDELVWRILETSL